VVRSRNAPKVRLTKKTGANAGVGTRIDRSPGRPSGADHGGTIQSRANGLTLSAAAPGICFTRSRTVPPANYL
jgi:hypothetical protein